MKNRSFNHLLTLGLPILFAVLALIFQWNALYPDGIAYLDIAEKYANGYFHEAINFYWSPLFSWIIALFIKVGIPKLIAAKIFNFLIFFIGLSTWNKLCVLLNRQTNPAVLFTIQLAGGINLAYFSQAMVGPDFLATVLLLIFILQLFANKSEFRIGLFLLLLCFAKTYLFFWGVGAIVFFVFFHARYTGLKSKILAGLKISIVVLPVLLIWIGLGYQKYGVVQLSSAGKYNNMYKVPGGFDHAWLNAGLIQPPDNHSTFVWTDITGVYQKYAKYRKLVKINNFEVLINNIQRAIRLILFNCLPGMLFLLIYIGLLIRKKIKMNSNLNLLAIFAFLNMGGYLLFASEHRYFWPSFLLISIIPLLLNYEFKFTKKINLVFVSIIFLLSCTHSLIRIFDVRFNPNNVVDSREIVKLVPKNSRVASYHTKQTWMISFYNGYKDYGGIDVENCDSIRSKYKYFNIDYLVIPDSNLNEISCADLKNKNWIKANNWWILNVKK